MKRIVNLMLVLTLLLAMLTVGTLHAAAADPAPAGETVECEQALYVETFDQYEASADTEAVLAALGWKKLLKGEGAENQNNTSFEFKDGKLYFKNQDKTDGYYEITALSGSAMEEVFGQTYTVQYDVTYTYAGIGTRYANFLTEYTHSAETGKSYYNTVHFRISGYGNNQCRYNGKWVDYEAKDENNLYAKLDAEDPENGYTTICKKLLGQDIDTAVMAFQDITVTIRVVYDYEKGPIVYIKTLEMDEFVKVSQYSANSNAAQYSTDASDPDAPKMDLWKAWEGESVVFKTSVQIGGYIDNVYMWLGDGDFEHSWSDWTVVSEADCFNKRVEKRTCSGCKSVETRVVGEALGHDFGEGLVCSRCEQDKYSKGLKYKLLNGNYTVTGIGTCTDTEIRIPATYEGKPVNAIASSAFKNNTTITRVIIPEGVTNIGGSAFYDCSNLISVSIPDTVTNIGASAFYKCNNLIYNVDSNAQYLGNEENPYLVLMAITDTQITSFEFYPQTKIIWGSAFVNCKKIGVIDIPEGITQIQNNAFGGCAALRSISIPASAVDLSIQMLRNCKNLEAIVVAEGNPKYHSINNCIIITETKQLHTGCKNSVIPVGGEVVTTIGNCAFETVSFTTFHIPAGITRIGTNAFQGCSNLESVIIDVSVTNIVNQAFRNCTNLKTVYYTGTAEDWAKITIGETDNQYLLGATVKYIGEWHIDIDQDHDCECGCDLLIGEHADSANDADHLCDYGCGAVVEACVPAEDDGDCTTDVLCTVCGEIAIKGAKAHTPAEDDGDCTTAINCAICGMMLKAGADDHIGGTATCDKKAECDVCGTAYGELLPHTPVEDDGDCTTDIACAVCGCVTIEGASAHALETTADERIICTVCGMDLTPPTVAEQVVGALDSVNGVLNSVEDFLGEVIDTPDEVRDALNVAKDTVDITKNAVEVVDGAVDVAKDTVKDTISAATESVNALQDAVGNTVGNTLNAAKNTVDTVTDAVQDTVNDAVQETVNKAEQTVESVTNQAEEAAQNALLTLNDMLLNYFRNMKEGN